MILGLIFRIYFLLGFNLGSGLLCAKFLFLCLLIILEKFLFLLVFK